MDREAAKKRIEKLRAVIGHHRYLYHVLDRQEISDDALDSLKKELFDLEQQYPELITPDSPTQRVAGKPLKGFVKVRHPGRMISLNDAFSEQDMSDWLTRLENHLGGPYRGDFYCDLKMDGLAIELLYQDGVLTRASTRGDGTTGEDVTQNIRTVDAVPLRLRDDELKIPKTVLVRGETYLTKTEFRKINSLLEKAGEKIYANPRNLAAGTVRQLDPKVPAGRKLSFYAWSVVDAEGTYGDGFKTHEDEFAALRKWGIPTNPHGTTARTLKEVFDFYYIWREKRDKLDYEFDGTVISVNDNAVYRRSGIVGKAPRGAMAFKFSPRQAQTIVEDIVVQVGRTGVLTPVAYLRPVSIGGTTISRATLHNLDEIKRLGVKIGDTVIVGRAGDVIPDILKVLPGLRPKNAKEFHMPRKCPVCGQDIERIEGQVAFRCVNKNCPALRREAIYHFVSRKAFNIEGIGPKIIDQLMEEIEDGRPLVEDIADLFLLKKEQLLNLEGFAEKSAQNAIDTIQNVANGKRGTITPSRFIYALGIEHVGEETAVALERSFLQTTKRIGKEEGKWWPLTELVDANLEDLQNVNDIGPVVAESVYEWFRSKENLDLLRKLKKVGVWPVGLLHKKTSSKLSGKTFVLTGTLESLSRDEAKDKIRELGGDVSSSVSKETDYVIAGAEPGSKYQKAEKLGVRIISEAEFLKILK